MSAAKATYDFLIALFKPNVSPTPWRDLKPDLREIFKITSYDERVTALCRFSGNRDIDYAQVNERLAPQCMAAFVQAACKHLAEALRFISALPTTA